MDRHVSLTGDGAAGLQDSSLPAGGGTLRTPKRWRWRVVMAAVLLAALAASLLAADGWLRITTIGSIPPPPVPVSSLFADPVPIAVTVTAGGQRAPWLTTEHELRESAEIWKRMHLEDWDRVPAALREVGLDNLMRRYAGILNHPPAWDGMTAFDWDATPQPVRTVAFRRMMAYWSGYYQVGAEFELESPIVAETLEAIVMSESWFDHRARSLNRDGTYDVGLAQASAFARSRLRELHARGRVDVSVEEEDYDNPWMATRFVALWMMLMLEETNGDLDRAVRAYNRGIGDAADSLGTDYLAAVQRRLTRYIRNSGAPPSWEFAWHRSRELIRAAREP